MEAEQAEREEAYLEDQRMRLASFERMVEVQKEGYQKVGSNFVSPLQQELSSSAIYSECHKTAYEVIVVLISGAPLLACLLASLTTTFTTATVTAKTGRCASCCPHTVVWPVVLLCASNLSQGTVGRLTAGERGAT